jgi:hypothetical protein
MDFKIFSEKDIYKKQSPLNKAKRQHKKPILPKFLGFLNPFWGKGLSGSPRQSLGQGSGETF